MKTVTNDFKNELKLYGREFDDIITYNGTTLGQDDLINVTLSYDGSLLKTQMKCLKVNCNTLIDVGTTINYQLGLKVNGDYEYIDYGNYIVKEIEEEKNTNSYLMTCYDKMLLTMVDYQSIREYTATTDNTFQDDKKYYIYTIDDEYILYTGPTTGNPSSLNLYEDTTYPINLQKFVTRICNYLGITFANRQSVKNFTNYDQTIDNELYATYREYVDENLNQTIRKWENNGCTFRDVLDDVAEATGSFIIINDNDELEIKTPNKNLLNTSLYVRKYINNGIIDDNKYAMFTTPIKISDINIHRSYYFTSKQNVYKFYIYCYDSDNSYLGSVSSGTNVSSYNFVPEVLVFGNSIDHILLGINYDNSHDITDTIINNLELQFEKSLLDYARIDYQPYNAEIIDEEYFNDNNVNVGKKYGPINVLILNNGGVDYREYPVVTNDRVVLRIYDNPILSNNNQYINYEAGIYDNVSDIEYYVGDFNTKGLLYYELGDYMNFSLRGATYRCLMLNDEIMKTSGLKEYIYVDEPEASVEDYKYIDSTKKAYFLADKANGLAEMIVEGIGTNGEVTGASVIASINDDTSQLKLNADKIYINGVTFDQNQTMTMTEGTINIEQRPGGENSIYTYRNYPDDHEIHESSLVPEGMIADIRDTNTDNITMWGEYYASNFRVQDNSNNMIYGDATNLSMINSNNDTTFEVDGPTGNITTSGDIASKDVVVESIRCKNMFNNHLINNQWVNTSGGIDAASNSSTQKFFCQAGDTFTLKATYSSSGNTNIIVMAFYNSSGTLLNRQVQTNSTTLTITATAPNNTYYMLAGHYSNIPTTIQLEKGNNATTFSEYQGIGYVSGSNANGSYVKYDDGRLECWNEITQNSLAITTSSGGLYASNIITPFPNFPVAFTSRPVITITSQCASQYVSFAMKAYPPSTTNPNDLRVYGTWSSTQNVTLSYYAVGRWK